MSEWKEYKLGGVIELIGGGTPKTNNLSFWGGEIPWLSVVDFNNGRKYVSQTEKSITEDGLNNSSTKILDKGDIIISARGTVGVIAMLDKPMAFNQSCYGIRSKEKFSFNDYLYYLLKNTVAELSQFSHGGVFDTITRDTFNEIDILLPPLPEQKAIASVLSSLDNKIDLLHRQNATLEKMAETLFRQWFVEEAKEEWEEKKLDELLTITSSKRIFYAEYVSSGVPFYRSKEIIELRNTGSTKSELYISNSRFEEIRSKFGSPQEGDILMTSVGTLGVAYRVKSCDNFYFKDGNLTWFKDFKDIPSSIIYLWLISKIGQEELNSITIGSTQQALTIEGLKGIVFRIPPKKVIAKCEKEFDVIISKIDTNQQKIRILTSLRDTLLPKLMSGKVKIN
jgi:type I restriction enzyme S subunit